MQDDFEQIEDAPTPTATYSTTLLPTVFSSSHLWTTMISFSRKGVILRYPSYSVLSTQSLVSSLSYGSFSFPSFF